MNETEFDRTARAWLDDGPNRMSDRALLSALEEIHTTRQRRVIWPARRATPVNIFARAAIAAVLVVGVGFAAVNLLPLGSSSPGLGGNPTPSPSPSSSPAASVVIPALTQSFVSSSNGFSIQHPADAGIVRATEAWNPATDQNNANFDFIHTESTGSFRGSSTEVPDGLPIDDWIDNDVQRIQPGGCAVPRSETPEITIDGQPGRVWEGCPNEIEATVVAGGRVYLFTLFGEGISRQLFDAYVATIDLRPEDAKSPPSPGPSPS